jgi:hypothetical protein
VKYYKIFGINVIYLVTGKIWGNLIPRVMKASSWDIPQTVRLIGSSTKEQKL